MADLDAATARIAEELNSQYLLGFSSPKGADGQYHSLRVAVTSGDYRVRARNGYVATRRCAAAKLVDSVDYQTAQSAVMPLRFPGPRRAVRAFNRFYTRGIGVLDELLRGPFSLAEIARPVRARASRRATAADLRRDLRLDAGYLSRLLRRFAARRLVRRSPARDDRRQRILRLTPRGRAALRPLETRARGDVAARLDRLTHGDRQRAGRGNAHDRATARRDAPGAAPYACAATGRATWAG